MQTDLKGNKTHSENQDPPLPPAPHFDATEIAEAKPVEPLAVRPLPQRMFKPRPIAGTRVVVLVIIAVFGLGSIAGFATVFVKQFETHSDYVDKTAAPTIFRSQPLEQEAAQVEGTRIVGSRNDQRRSESRRRIVVRQPNKSDEADDGTPKARLVAVYP